MSTDRSHHGRDKNQKPNATYEKLHLGKNAKNPDRSPQLGSSHFGERSSPQRQHSDFIRRSRRVPRWHNQALGRLPRTSLTTHPARVRSPRHQPTTKMKTSDKKLYNALAYFVIFGKQLKNTLEELNFAIQKSEEILLAQNLKTSTRSKK